MEPISLYHIPHNSKIMYEMMVCDHQPLKIETYRCRLVVGGDKLNYDQETAVSAANLLEAKLILNCTISTPNAKFFTMDIKDFFLSHKPIQFCLCVDDFGVKYTNKEDVIYLLNALQTKYKITVDWEGTHYCGLTLSWDHDKRYVNISMPGYIEKLLQCLVHTHPTKPVHAPHEWNRPIFGRYVQPSTSIDTSSRLPHSETKIIQSIVGELLYYTRAVDLLVYPALNEVSLTQAAPTELTLKKCHHLLDYVS